MYPLTPRSPRRIIHVANFGFKPTKVYLHHTAAKLSNGWTRAGHHVINFSDRDIARWRSPFGYKPLGKLAVNRLLQKLCRDVQPDVVAFGHADTITAETIAAIRSAHPHVKMLQWNFDWWVPSNHALSDDPTVNGNKERILSKRDVLDATFLTTAGAPLQEIATPSHIAGFMPNPVDPSLERGRNFERTDLPYDLFFASNSADDRRHHCGEWRPMNEFCKDIQASILGLRCAFFGVNGAAPVFGPAYEKAIQLCRIGLNISRRNDAYLYSSDRLAHLIGNGLVVCMDAATGYRDIFGDDEISFYSSESELIENLYRFKRDDALRRQVAERGWKRYFDLFDSAIIGQYMLDAVFGDHDPSRYPWPTTQSLPHAAPASA